MSWVLEAEVLEAVGKGECHQLDSLLLQVSLCITTCPGLKSSYRESKGHVLPFQRLIEKRGKRIKRLLDVYYNGQSFFQ